MITIQDRIGNYPGETELQIIIEATNEENEVISALYADINTHQIMSIETAKEYRLQGHARSLIDYAISNDIELFHSPAWSCTAEGAAFAEACDDIDTIADEDAYGWEDFAATLVDA